MDNVSRKKESKLPLKPAKTLTKENDFSLLDAYSVKANKPTGIAAQFSQKRPLPISKPELKNPYQKLDLPPKDVDRPNYKTLSNQKQSIHSSQSVKRPAQNLPSHPPSLKKAGIASQLSVPPKRSGIAAQFGSVAKRPMIATHSGSIPGVPKRSGIAAQFGGSAPERMNSYSSEEEEYDSDLADFIDDSEVVSQREYSNAIEEIQKSLRFDPTKYAKVSKYDDCSTMEASYRDISREEARSLRIGAKEDAELFAQETERKKRKMQRVRCL
ncbi:hypothetical protein Ciccas_000191 [Cichlidogyrus casuarinus]|uniref:Protein SPT2 homolog n=1 Tax=Cichlidogyrus casuarinus TaxID=1844966 RepID=A0ABD2QQY5_9PLAT